MTDDLRELLADLAHQQWAGWMEHLFSKCKTIDVYDEDGDIDDTEDGCIQYCVIPQESVERWKHQMATPYSELTEPEKDSDRKEADNVLRLLRVARITE